MIFTLPSFRRLRVSVHVNAASKSRTTRASSHPAPAASNAFLWPRPILIKFFRRPNTPEMTPSSLSSSMFLSEFSSAATVSAISRWVANSTIASRAVPATLPASSISFSTASLCKFLRSSDFWRLPSCCFCSLWTSFRSLKDFSSSSNVSLKRFFRASKSFNLRCRTFFDVCFWA